MEMKESTRWPGSNIYKSYTQWQGGWLKKKAPWVELYPRKHEDKDVYPLTYLSDGRLPFSVSNRFVAMRPACHADYLMAWAGQTNVPIVSIDYKKAPEFPFPHGLNECFDVYKMIVSTKGACIGLNGAVHPRIALTGDSA